METLLLMQRQDKRDDFAREERAEQRRMDSQNQFLMMMAAMFGPKNLGSAATQASSLSLDKDLFNSNVTEE
jgi:hypothetical protein